MDVNWDSVLPMWVSQTAWNITIIVVIITVVRRMLRDEGDRVAATLAPLIRRVEQLGFVIAEQAAMNASALERVIGGQAHAVTQVSAVPRQTADIVGYDAAVVAVERRLNGSSPPVVKTEAAIAKEVISTEQPAAPTPEGDPCPQPPTS